MKFSTGLVLLLLLTASLILVVATQDESPKSPDVETVVDERLASSLFLRPSDVEKIVDTRTKSKVDLSDVQSEIASHNFTSLDQVKSLIEEAVKPKASDSRVGWYWDKLEEDPRYIVYGHMVDGVFEFDPRTKTLQSGSGEQVPPPPPK